jgi:bacterioferritin-associated ferredoxin
MESATFIDDLIVYGRNKAEHDQNLRVLLKRLNVLGLTVSAEKCMFGVDELVLFGLKVSKNGISLSDSKIDALVNAKAPSTMKEVRSFLGLANYCGKHIPSLATLAEPLWSLVDENKIFEWNEVHDNELTSIKDAIVTKVFLIKSGILN